MVPACSFWRQCAHPWLHFAPQHPVEYGFLCPFSEALSLGYQSETRAVSLCRRARLHALTWGQTCSLVTRPWWEFCVTPQPQGGWLICMWCEQTTVTVRESTLSSLSEVAIALDIWNHTMVRKCHHSKEFITVSVKHGAFTAFYGKPLQTLLETTPLLKSPFYGGFALSSVSSYGLDKSFLWAWRLAWRRLSFSDDVIDVCDPSGTGHVPGFSRKLREVLSAPLSGSGTGVWYLNHSSGN